MPHTTTSPVTQCIPPKPQPTNQHQLSPIAGLGLKILQLSKNRCLLNWRYYYRSPTLDAAAHHPKMDAAGNGPRPNLLLPPNKNHRNGRILPTTSSATPFTPPNPSPRNPPTFCRLRDPNHSQIIYSIISKMLTPAPCWSPTPTSTVRNPGPWNFSHVSQLRESPSWNVFRGWSPFAPPPRPAVPMEEFPVAPPLLSDGSMEESVAPPPRPAVPIVGGSPGAQPPPLSGVPIPESLECRPAPCGPEILVRYIASHTT